MFFFILKNRLSGTNFRGATPSKLSSAIVLRVWELARLERVSKQQFLIFLCRVVFNITIIFIFRFSATKHWNWHKANFIEQNKELHVKFCAVCGSKRREKKRGKRIEKSSASKSQWMKERKKDWKLWGINSLSSGDKISETLVNLLPCNWSSEIAFVFPAISAGICRRKTWSLLTFLGFDSAFVSMQKTRNHVACIRCCHLQVKQSKGKRLTFDLLFRLCLRGGGVLLCFLCAALEKLSKYAHLWALNIIKSATNHRVKSCQRWISKNEWRNERLLNPNLHSTLTYIMNKRRPQQMTKPVEIFINNFLFSTFRYVSHAPTWRKNQ